MTIDFNTIVGIATVLGTLAAWIALWPIAKPYLKRFTGGISRLTAHEETYLLSLAKDLEQKNQKNRWSDKFYVDVDTEIYKQAFKGTRFQ